jgi:hypothetical protein
MDYKPKLAIESNSRMVLYVHMQTYIFHERLLLAARQNSIQQHRAKRQASKWFQNPQRHNINPVGYSDAFFATGDATNSLIPVLD